MPQDTFSDEEIYLLLALIAAPDDDINPTMREFAAALLDVIDREGERKPEGPRKVQ